MSVPSSGLARLTIRAPRRRLDLAVPHQVPLAELLPEVLQRAGEAGSEPEPGRSGWLLRRGDGASLNGDASLAQQGVRDGDVLYLVPRQLTWPEPQYDDVVEEIATGARRHGRAWEAATTRAFALVAAGLVLVTGLAVLVAVGPDRSAPALIAAAVAAVLLLAGTILSRAVGDGVAAAAAGGYALPYAAAAGVLFAAGAQTRLTIGPDQVLVGACALLLAAVVGVVAVGHGLRVFAAGVTAGLLAVTGATLGYVLSAPGSAAVLTLVLVAGIGLAPLFAVRLGKLPLPVVSAAPEVIAAEPRPSRSALHAAVARADDILAGVLAGIAVTALGAIAVLAATSGVAGPLLGGLMAAALLVRARLFPSVAARLPLLVSGLLGLAVTAARWAAGAGAATRLVAVGLAFAAVVALLTTAATASRRRGLPSPYLGRLGDILDIATVVALAPVACAVLNLYAWVRALAN